MLEEGLRRAGLCDRHEVWQRLVRDIIELIHITCPFSDRQRIKAAVIDYHLVHHFVAPPFLVRLRSGVQIPSIDRRQRYRPLE